MSSLSPAEGKPILVVCLNPVLQRTLLFDDWAENEVNRTDQYYLDASGKGVNVSRVLSQLGAKALHLTHAGGRERDHFLQMCADDGLELAWVESESEIRTCTTLLNRRNRSSTELVEEARPVAPETEGRVRRRFLELIEKAALLVISGTKAAGYSEELYPWMAGEAERREVPVVLDIKGPDLEGSLRHHPLLIKPNLAEFVKSFLGKEMESEQAEDQELLDEALAKMRSLSAEFGTSVVLTRGGKGLLAYHQGEIIHREALPLTPVNTIGCGDAFTAGCAFELARGGRFDDALDLGTKCAAANARLIKPGAIKEEQAEL